MSESYELFSNLLSQLQKEIDMNKKPEYLAILNTETAAIKAAIEAKVTSLNYLADSLNEEMMGDIIFDIETEIEELKSLLNRF